MNKVHKLIEPEPPPPPQLSNSETAIKPEDPTANSEELQWIQDTTYSANIDINNTQAQNHILNNGETYTIFVRKI